MAVEDRRAGITDASLEMRPNIDTNRFRQRRFKLVADRLESLKVPGKTLRVLDIGGVIAYWEGVRDAWSHIPIEITIVNLGSRGLDKPPFLVRDGDACAMPQYADNSFDLVHSNSVIEHVGRWDEMSRMAAEVRRLAPSYFVQTPNFWFPVEPHYRSLFFHWYPEVVRARMLLTKRRGFTEQKPSLDAAMRNIQAVNLLTSTQMAALFPDARIVDERFYGLTKSIMAIR